MTSKLSSPKALYTALGGSSDTAATLTSEIAVLNGILALGEVDSCQFIPDAIQAIADNLSDIVPASIDENLVAENIKKGITILGVTGTYDGN